LSKETHNPVKYEKKDKVTGDTLTAENIIKGYQYEPGQYVIIDQEDIDKVKLKSTKVIEIEGFVDASEVHPTLYDSPYFAGPDGDIAGKTYALLCKTLKETGKVGVGKVVLRDRESVVLLTPQENGLLLYKLRFPNEIKSMKDVPAIEDAEADEEQVKLAKTLVESMTKSFDQIEMKDKYKDALREIIHAKIEGREVISVEEDEPPVVDIMTALKASIDQAKSEKKPMRKAKGKAETKEKKTTKTKRKSA
jgi:DNA end-binding protein Ku